MQKRAQLLLVATAAAGAFIIAGCASYGAKPKYTVEQAMDQGFKGKESPAARVGKGEGSPADIKLLAELTRAMALNPPPQGDPASWKEKTTALAAAGQMLAEGKPGALEAWKTAVNCKACHSVHKPEKK